MAYWTFRSIDTMSRSRDQAQSQAFMPQIPVFVRQIAKLHPTHMTYCGPYDEPTTYGAQPGWMDRWLQEIRATGRRVWFRMIWNNWSGTFGQPVYSYQTTPAIPAVTAGGAQAVLNGTDTTSYVAKTYQWILAHPTAFRDGDVFTPLAEPANAGIRPFTSAVYPQFASYREYNLFLQAATVACRAAFQRLGRRVFVGLWAPGTNPQEVTAATSAILGSPQSQDLYTQDPATMVQQLTTLAQVGHIKAILGEWGANAEATEAQRVALVHQMYGAVAQLPFVTGVNYFEAWSYPANGTSLSQVGPAGDGLLDRETLAILPHGQAVGQWFARQTPPWRRRGVQIGAGIGLGALGTVGVIGIRQHQKGDHKP